MCNADAAIGLNAASIGMQLGAGISGADYAEQVGAYNRQMGQYKAKIARDQAKRSAAKIREQGKAVVAGQIASTAAANIQIDPRDSILHLIETTEAAVESDAQDALYIGELGAWEALATGEMGYFNAQIEASAQRTGAISSLLTGAGKITGMILSQPGSAPTVPGAASVQGGYTAGGGMAGGWSSRPGSPGE